MQGVGSYGWPVSMAATDTAELRHFYTIEGWRVNHKRMERIWREEGLKVPKKQPKQRRLWFQRARAFGYVRIVVTTYGAFASRSTVPPMAGLFGSWLSRRRSILRGFGVERLGLLVGTCAPDRFIALPAEPWQA